jgi:two-component system response regulator AtoC
MSFELLIIDDEEIVCYGLSRILNDKGYSVDFTVDGIRSLEMIKEKGYDLILLDIDLPQKSGVELLHEIRQISSDSLVIMITAYNDVSLAVRSIKAGAHDYYVKAGGYDELLIKIEKALEIRRLRKDVDRLQETLYRDYNVDRFIGSDPKIKQVFNNIRRVALTPHTTVLISGESGTGKEVAAKYIHYLSSKKNNPFIAVNCASIAPGLCESEFFGHEKGAFTDARIEKKGVFELAQGGTLFLDEIGSMNLELQGSLLRVLEEKKFRRLGAIRDTKVDVRVIAATNKDPESLVKRNVLREDLLYRLNSFQITLPPLRDRKGDVIELAYFFMRNFNNELGKNFEEIDAGAKTKLYNYDYPGNVRELKNIIERAMILGDERKITSKYLSDIIPTENNAMTNTYEDEIIPLKQMANRMEKEYIMKVIKLCNGNKSEAARKLGISRSTLNLHIGRTPERNLHKPSQQTQEQSGDNITGVNEFS